jgi:hypothetical protein
MIAEVFDYDRPHIIQGSAPSALPPLPADLDSLSWAPLDSFIMFPPDGAKAGEAVVVADDEGKAIVAFFSDFDEHWHEEAQEEETLYADTWTLTPSGKPERLAFTPTRWARIAAP